MKHRAYPPLILVCLFATSSVALAQGSKISIDENGALVANGKRVFPIAFTLAPRPETTAPSGKPALQELRAAGALLLRSGPVGEVSTWDDHWIAEEQKWQDGGAKAGMFCTPWLKDLAEIEPGDKAKEAKLKMVIDRFKDNPGMGLWKG